MNAVMVKLLLVVCGGAVVVSGELGVAKRDVRLCGRMLVEALSFMCNGEYYDPNDDARGKRSSELQQALLDPYPGWFAVALSGRGGTSDLHKRDRGTGIVDECCRRSCSAATLLSYCRRVD